MYVFISIRGGIDAVPLRLEAAASTSQEAKCQDPPRCLKVEEAGD